MQTGRNISYNISSFISRAARSLANQNKRVTFNSKRTVRVFQPSETPIMITYDSGADGHYISEQDRVAAGLPILRRSNKRVGVANGGSSQAKHVTALPFKQLSKQANQADSFDDFPHSLMSVGRTADDGTVSIFTKDGVTVHKEQDVLIKCQGEPIFIGIRDEQGRYRIPLIHQRGQWQPRKPSKKARRALERANSVYDLPSIEQAIKWMHAVCGYPVKSTWLKAIKATPQREERQQVLSRYRRNSERSHDTNKKECAINKGRKSSGSFRNMQCGSTITRQERTRHIHQHL